MLDNVLAREARKLVGMGRRGRSRRIPIDALELVAVALILNRDLKVSIAHGLQLAMELVAAPDGRINVGSLAALQFELGHLRATLAAAVDDAIEGVALRPRGRPQQRRS